jgi:ribosomal-protein-alanine N-acetyltransferase
MKKQTIITNRLILRKVKLEDALPMFLNWANDKEFTKYMTWNPHENVEVTKQIINMWLEEEKEDTTIRFMIALRDCDEPIGSIDVVNYIDGNPEIGYCLSRKYWNKGYMTEAAKAFIQYLLNEGFTIIHITAAVDNIGSNKVIEKCGFTFVKEERLEHHSIFKPEPITVNKYILKR